MEKFRFNFDCKQKFGCVAVEAESYEQAKEKAKEKLRGSAWCNGKCNTCKLKITNR